ncbi:L,D-transpeptidase [Paracoccus sp. Z330]|uniref:L,D-transpeptidase n=1 Tax=Paracoccus onchidii TaxID=3017813 RepID=A0ABT4ZBH8_9RHOB|nr:L,D-transpeptidase [Paracoccus onchidii]MDB6176713.1 L,D-transpeptidase [Paracoccus onchidii]
MRLAPLYAALALGLAACAPTTQSSTPSGSDAVPAVYQARTDIGPQGEPVAIPEVRSAYLTERNRRQRVAYNGPESPGTIVVDPYARVLYDVLENGEAMRFGIAVGRAGRGFNGSAVISVKKQWPGWTPTQNMIRTEPELYAQFAGGLPGGLNNPLGSRALYLYRNGRDTYYRIHGTMDPSSIGKATSAGCIRLFNQDIIDLFDETEIGSRVKVRTQAESIRLEGQMTETPEGYVVPVAEMPVATGQSATLAAAQSPVESAVPAR